MAEKPTARYVAALMVLSAFCGLTTRSYGQVSRSEQSCIATFNKGIGKVAKAQGQAVGKCLNDFAAGRLVSTTPETCLVTDVFGRVSTTTNLALKSISSRCVQPFPFGTAPITDAVPDAVITEIDLVHGAIGRNLDTALVSTTAGAHCQASVSAALRKCSDMRRREFIKCQKAGLRAGVITDAASLEATCLGTGDDPQPDPRGKIARACGDIVTAAIAGRCGGVDLAVAFPPCGSATQGALASCLAAESGCQVCRFLNELDGLARDCDRFDDGNGNNGSCGAECGDGILQDGEPCDDGNQNSGDGCSNACRVEPGWSCSGSPSVCTPTCGNGVLDAGEECDDGGTANGDGCSAACTVETGYTCTGSPSVCTRNCGNGIIGAGETCDDGNGASGDGCSSSCQVEPGYKCTGQPSVCTFVCGNGVFDPGETCDDGDTTAGDGCSPLCQIEPGWLCSGMPSHCVPLCGDGLIRGGETCDDGNATSGDGCSFTCQVEAGFSCVGSPSNCTPNCGDGFIRGAETCDDGNAVSGDGCSGVLCRQEVGWTCAGQPSVCHRNCGNGHLDPQEECDDGNLVNGDGCNAGCRAEPGYACGGEPSVCVHTCGNGFLDAGETCDDGNTTNRDGCSASCRTESGWYCGIPGTPCSRFDVFIDTPAHGIFTTASSITVTGHYTTLPAGHAAITFNGVPASVGEVNPVTRTFSHTLPLSQAAIFNPMKVSLTNTDTGEDVRDRIVVIDGPSVADGALSPQSVALRMNDSGLDSIEPIVGQLAASQLNIGALLPAGTVISDSCAINTFLGCLGSARVTIANPPPSYGSLAFNADSMQDFVEADITINNIRIDVDINGSGLVPSCGLRLTANALLLNGNYAMQPENDAANNVDVNLTGPMGVNFAGFNHTFTSGICDAPIIGDIINALLPDIQSLAVNGIKGFLDDPDGSGPQESPIAEGFETALAGISIAGPIGQGVGLMFESPLFDVLEDPTGITFGSNSRFTVSVGNGPGQCVPPPGAPNFTASYAPASTFPTFGATTPVAHTPYGLGIAISTAAFNQLLRGETECGLMRTSLSTIDIDGPGGAPPLPITAGVLSLLSPEFGQLPGNTPLRVDIAPTLAPVLTGNAGPNGELAELKIAHIAIDIVEPGPETVWLSGAFDARLGLNFAFLPDGSGLSISISEPSASDLTMTVIDNPLGTNEAQIEAVLPGLIRAQIPDLAGALAGFPLPQFFGLSLGGVEVSRTGGQFMGLYANLTPAP
jgi:cysteine-rich repeat protein